MREEDPWTFMPKIVISNQEPRLRSAHIIEANNNQGGGPAQAHSLPSGPTSKTTTPKQSSHPRANPPNPSQQITAGFGRLLLDNECTCAKVLIVDDNDFNILSLQTILEVEYNIKIDSVSF